MIAPISITVPDRTAVNRTPILSRMIPAKIRKNTKTFRKTSDPCIVPNAVESHPRVSCIRSLMGERMSMNMYEQNMARAKSRRAVQRIAAESLSVFFTVSVIFFANYNVFLNNDGFPAKIIVIFCLQSYKKKVNRQRYS